jgi:hypothetical protein
VEGGDTDTHVDVDAGAKGVLSIHERGFGLCLVKQPCDDDYDTTRRERDTKRDAALSPATPKYTTQQVPLDIERVDHPAA